MAAFPHCEIADLEGLLWLHVSLLSLAGVLVISSFLSQFKDAAPYGRHASPEKAKGWGPQISQRIGHFVSDAIPGVPVALTVYLLYAGLLPPGGRFSEVHAVNVVLLLGWLLHYVWRGFVTPLIMPYSSKTVALGITLAGIFPNVIFGYMNAAQLACTLYPSDWAARPRFIIGVVLYAAGTAVNRWADLKLRAGRLQRLRKAAQQESSAAEPASQQPPPQQQQPPQAQSLLPPGAGEDSGGGGRSGLGSRQASDSAASGGDSDTSLQARARERYFIPRGGLYEFVSCPNYLGELVEWAGYALAVWSWPSLAWALFGASTFVPRALTHHRWYRETFGDEYPAKRKALIPFML